MPRKNELFYESLDAKIKHNLKTGYGQTGQFSYAGMGLEKTSIITILFFQIWNKIELQASSAEIKGVTSSQFNHNGELTPKERNRKDIKKVRSLISKDKQNTRWFTDGQGKIENRDPVDLVIHCIFILARIEGSGYLTAQAINEKLRELDAELNIKNLLKRIGAYVDTGYIERVKIEDIKEKDMPNGTNSKTTYCFRVKKESFDYINAQYDGKEDYTLSASLAAPLMELVAVIVDVIKLFDRNQLNEIAKSMPEQIKTYKDLTEDPNNPQLYFKFQ